MCHRNDDVGLPVDGLIHQITRSRSTAGRPEMSTMFHRGETTGGCDKIKA